MIEAVRVSLGILDVLSTETQTFTHSEHIIFEVDCDNMKAQQFRRSIPVFVRCTEGFDEVVFPTQNPQTSSTVTVRGAMV